jgi:hypothetical protein
MINDLVSLLLSQARRLARRREPRLAILVIQRQRHPGDYH